MEIICTEQESPSPTIKRYSVETDMETTASELLLHSPMLDLIDGRRHLFTTPENSGQQGTNWTLDIHLNQ